MRHSAWSTWSSKCRRRTWPRWAKNRSRRPDRRQYRTIGRSQAVFVREFGTFQAVPGRARLRQGSRPPGHSRSGQGRQLLIGWLSWASHSRIPEFVALARSIRRYRDLMCNTLDHGLSNARSEATNSHLRALTKRAYGFHSPGALIAMALLTRGGSLPTTTRPRHMNPDPRKRRIHPGDPCSAVNRLRREAR
ncbi:MAG TPA: transposase [Mycobacterium sp.]|nr:transposase [Mycobacterium sp.]HUH70465.1 transposase [Mycobacterium sp.]